MAKSSASIDSFLEEYISKLEQRYVAQNQQLNLLIDNVASCIILLDDQLRPTFMNMAAKKVTGYTLREVQRRTIHATIHCCIDPADCPITAAINRLESLISHEGQFWKKDGTAFSTLYSIIPLHQDQQLSGAILEFQDITRLKELERQKDDFIAIASHELKTPVTSIQNYTQTLERRFKKRGDDESATLLRRVNDQLQRLTTLITSLLDVTKLDAGRLPLHQVKTDYDHLVSEAVESFRLNTSVKQQILISGRINQPLSIDPERIHQVLTNLLTNAIKYSPGTDRVEIELKTESGRAVTRVRDFGIGIPATQRSQIFDRFYRVDGVEQRTFSGLGLGLYISAEIIRQHGGDISVESKEGQGSTFSFWLPLESKS